MKCSLRDSIFIGFCSVFIVCARAALRLHLKIPGHSMFFSVFFLLIARGAVSFRWAATLCGFLSGLLALTLGMGHGGPLLILKFVLPGITVDLMAMILPGLFESIFLCMLTGMFAGITQFIIGFGIEMLMGMDFEVLIQHGLFKSIGNVIFGAAGGIAVPAVIKKLEAYGVCAPEANHLSSNIEG